MTTLRKRKIVTVKYSVVKKISKLFLYDLTRNIWFNRPFTIYTDILWFKIVCSRFQSCYLDENRCTLTNKIRKHLATEKNPYIFQNLTKNTHCKKVCNKNCYVIVKKIYFVSISFRLTWKKPFTSLDSNLTVKEKKQV